MSEYPLADKKREATYLAAMRVNDDLVDAST